MSRILSLRLIHAMHALTSMEIVRRKKSYFRRRVFIFVLLIRNKSPFSGKIITSFKIERMTLNLLAI